MNTPEIICMRRNGGFRATFGLELTSIGHSSVMFMPNADYTFGQAWKTSHQCNVQLLQTLSRWDHPCCLELHVLSLPSLDASIQGHNDFSLRFFVGTDSREEAMELALADSFRLKMLLDTLWPTARFQFMDHARLSGRYEPFTPQAGLMVGRRSQRICPANPLDIHRTLISGFGADSIRRREPSPTSSNLEILHIHPWIPSVGEDLSLLSDALLRLPTPRWVIVRIGSDAGSSSTEGSLLRLKSTIETCERFLSGFDSTQLTLTGQTHAIRDMSLDRFAQLSDSALRGAVLVFAPGSADFVTACLVGQSITGDHGRRQAERLFEGGFSVCEIDPKVALGNPDHFEDEPLTAEEAACAFRLPLIADHHNHGLQVHRHRTSECQMRVGGEQSLDHIQLGVNLHNGQSKPIYLNTSDRLRHILLIGATGTGKSTSLLSMALQDARAGRGFALIDPAGDLADHFLARFPHEREDDLVIVDLDDRESFVPLNLLVWKTPQERDLLIDTLYSTLLSTYRSADFFGPIFETHFRSALRLLLGDEPRAEFVPTLLELPRVFRSPSFRKYLLDQSTAYDVNAAIREADRVTYGDHKLENLAPYITSKFNRFLQDSQVRRIVGHGRMALDFRTMMDEGHIVVFKLAQGRLGRHICDILFAQLVARFRLAAMSRADIPETSRRPFFLYCDEFQVIADENFADMLSTSRKWALGLVLANQFATQLEQRGVLEAALANVGSIISFRVGVNDAKLLGPVFQPTVAMSDLVECPNWHGYMRIHAHQSPIRPFSFLAQPDRTPPDNAWAQHLREISRKRWGVTTDEADLAIALRNSKIEVLLDSRSAP